MDFTTTTYERLLGSLRRAGYASQTMSGFLESSSEKSILLRHDVDLLPENSLRMAHLERELGFVSSYYFRAVPESWDSEVIGKIDSLGHEVGYHYESLTTCKGNLEKAFDDFKRNLEKLRKLVPVSTICMHGSPRSSWDSRDMWKTYDYRSLGIVCEPYLDVDFDEVFYLTDTGRRWDGGAVSVRDKVGSRSSDDRRQRTDDRGRTTEDGRQRDDGKEDKKIRGLEVKQWPSFHSTFDIIEAVEDKRFPDKVMITVHPQRWTDDPFQWTRELILQNCKNLVKRFLISRAQ